MNRRALLLLPLMGLALAWPLTGPAQAPEDNVRINIVVGAPGKNKVPIALPTPVGGASEQAEFLEVVRRDLELSGWFTIIDSAGYIEPTGSGMRTGEFRFEDWDVPGAVALGKTSLQATATGQLRTEVWVYDVPGRRKLGAKAFTADKTATRALGHKVANEIILQVTGQPGPFNTRFAFAGSFTGNKEIYVVDFDGFGRRAITKNGSINIKPSWSSSGGQIAFTSFLSGNPDLYVADLGGGRIRRLSAREGINSGGAFSPFADLIALTLAPTGDPDVYTISSESGQIITRLTKSTGIDTSPAWSPDGSRLAFVSDRSGGAQIYMMNSDGSGVQRVTFQGSSNTDPAWSPDGTKLTYVTRDGNFDVMTCRVDGGGVTRITQSAGDNEDPSWSPDGNYIAFSSTRKGGAHIWMSTADGSHQVQLTEGKGGYTNPRWSPSLDW
jgi:TolB protein